ncbi:MAG: hypothetical protein ACFCUI_00130 [Bernardetiaceae bacterium]
MRTVYFLCFLLFFTYPVDVSAERTGRYVQVNARIQSLDKDGGPLQTRVKVWNREKKQYEQRIWQPDASSSECLMLLEAGFSYELYVQGNNFRPYVLPLVLPLEVYAYSFDVQVQFRELVLLGKPVGQLAQVLKHQEQFRYIHELSDSLVIELRNRFLVDFIHRMFLSENPYAMDELAYWMVGDTLPLPEQPQEGDSLVRYDQIMGKLEENIQDSNCQNLTEGITPRKTNLPLPQQDYFQADPDTRTHAEQPLVWKHSLMFPQKKRYLRRQKTVLATVNDFLKQHPSLTPTLHTQAELLPMTDQLNKHLSATSQIVSFDVPTTFPFADPWCRIDILLHAQ